MRANLSLETFCRNGCRGQREDAEEAAAATAQPRGRSAPLTTKRSQGAKEAAAPSNHQVRSLVRIGLEEADQAALNGQRTALRIEDPQRKKAEGAEGAS